MFYSNHLCQSFISQRSRRLFSQKVKRHKDENRVLITWNLSQKSKSKTTSWPNNVLLWCKPVKQSKRIFLMLKAGEIISYLIAVKKKWGTTSNDHKLESMALSHNSRILRCEYLTIWVSPVFQWKNPLQCRSYRKHGLIPGSRRSPGVLDNPLQYSCLENPMDRGVLWASVHRVAKSRTQLMWLSTCAYASLYDCLQYRYSGSLYLFDRAAWTK